MKFRARYFFISILLFALALPAMAKQFTLVIDAGHGGHDAGAVGKISKEKNINLTVALAFGALVERNCPDVKVIYTRKTDVFVTLDGRAEIANKAKADLFVSIHTNALPAGRIARGMETYTLGMHRQADNLAVAKRENEVITYEKDYKTRYAGFDPNSSESYIMFEFIQDKNMANSVDLAKMVQQETCRIASRPDKGVHQAGFLVLRQTSMPSCLIELGFISTPDEEQMLNTKSHTDNLALGIYNAFVKYKQKYTGKGGPKIEPTKPVAATETKAESNTEAAKADVKPKAEAKVETKPEATTEQKAELAQLKPEVAKADSAESRAAEKQPQTATVNDEAPVFKLQILTSSKPMPKNDSRLKGESADCYVEGGLNKYTVGASTNYQEIYQLRKTLLEKFPEAFIVAFKSGEKMNINEAIREYKNRK